MDNKKSDSYYIKKIITDLSFLLENTHGLSQADLTKNEILLDSVLFRLIQISENSDRLTEAFKHEYNSIPWRAIKGLRNKIVHEYGHVNLTVVYDTIQNDLPDLLSKLKQIATRLPE